MTERDEHGRFLKGHKKVGGRGSKKEASLKDFFKAMIDTFNELGGKKGLIQWAKKNEKSRELYYKMLQRLLEGDVLRQITMEEEEGELIPIQFVRQEGEEERYLLTRALEIFKEEKIEGERVREWTEEARSLLAKRKEGSRVRMIDEKEKED